jgi:hypothetical protein
MTDRAKYPALARLDDVQAEKYAVRDFLDWLGEQRIDLCTVIPGLAHDRWAPISEGYDKLIARHLGIDLDAVENERREILRGARNSEPPKMERSDG